MLSERDIGTGGCAVTAMATTWNLRRVADTCFRPTATEEQGCKSPLSRRIAPGISYPRASSETSKRGGHPVLGPYGPRCRERDRKWRLRARRARGRS